MRHELGITAFGVNAWLGPNVGDRVIPEHAEDQEGDQDELYLVVRGRARFEVGGDTVDAPQGALVYVPAGPTVRTAFAEESGTMVLAIGATPGKAFEVHGWEYWGPYHDLWVAGDYEGVVAKGRESIEANPYPMPLYNLACCESLAGHPEDAIKHLGMAIECGKAVVTSPGRTRTSMRSATSPVSASSSADQAPSSRRTCRAITSSSRAGTTCTCAPRKASRSATALRTSARCSPIPPLKAITSTPPSTAAIAATAFATWYAK